jgi:xanthine dehydrogenase molybdopterin-binding subunit B
VTSVDTSLVEEGVLVITPEDARSYGTYGCQIEDQQMLTEQPRFVGDPVLAVVAATEQAARDAVAVVEVELRRGCAGLR